MGTSSCSVARPVSPRLNPAHLRLIWCERALDFPWDARRSLALDDALLVFETATASGGAP